MKHFELKGQLRQVGNKAAIKAIRAQGLVPCNLYGLGMENVLFTVDAKELKGLTHTPASFIVDLVLDGKKYTAVVHELQFHPLPSVARAGHLAHDHRDGDYAAEKRLEERLRVLGRGAAFLPHDAQDLVVGDVRRKMVEPTPGCDVGRPLAVECPDLVQGSVQRVG